MITPPGDAYISVVSFAIASSVRSATDQSRSCTFAERDVLSAFSVIDGHGDVMQRTPLSRARTNTPSEIASFSATHASVTMKRPRLPKPAYDSGAKRPRTSAIAPYDVVPRVAASRSLACAPSPRLDSDQSRSGT